MRGALFEAWNAHSHCLKQPPIPGVARGDWRRSLYVRNRRGGVVRHWTGRSVTPVEPPAALKVCRVSECVNPREELFRCLERGVYGGKGEEEEERRSSGVVVEYDSDGAVGVEGGLVSRAVLRMPRRDERRWRARVAAVKPVV